MVRPGRWGVAVWLLYAAVASASAAQDDGVDLTVVHGPSPGEVRLDWTGGAPVYRVYRATSPVDLDTPAHLIGTTSGAVWIDSPLPGAIHFYSIHPPCTSIAFCDGNEFCSGEVCLPDQSDGSVCSSNDDCVSGHCDNGYCCASGVCCASPADCGAFASPPSCDDPSSCQGERMDGVCASNICAANPVADDSACAGLESQACGPYPSVLCTAAVSQPASQASLCPGTCADDPGCDPSAHCDAPSCLVDVSQGESCDELSDCASGLPCTDATCCDSACSGVCAACDLSGTEGTCTPVPSGQDPDAECGAMTCTGFYHSWSGDSCRRKADVAAALASCSGAGACRTQAQECTAQSAVGPTTVTCHPTCQDPNLATCAGTTAGACVNVNPGNQTCGLGACARTVAQCSNGAPLTCTPGTPSTETCNDIDDNCDGTVDNGAFGDAFEPNSICGAERVLNAVGSDQGQSYSTMTIYALGDFDYYRIHATETDSSCGCGAFSFDEDYQFRVTLTVPSSAGSYEVCLDGTGCNTFATCLTVAAGNAGTVSLFLDGECGPSTDAYDLYVRVRGIGSPAFECQPYGLSYVFDAGLCR